MPDALLHDTLHFLVATILYLPKKLFMKENAPNKLKFKFA